VIEIVLAGVALLLAAIPSLLFASNLRAYRRPPAPAADEPHPSVSVLIPARNEERSIRPAVEAALASRGVDVEVVVLDDRSDDATAAIVREIGERDPRVRLRPGFEPPRGWCGKQYACWNLAGAASHDLLLFLDADVRLHPDGVARLVAFLRESGAHLISGIPHQETGTLLERLLIPLIHFVLLGFLPIQRMRASRHPAYSAGCGQMFLVRRRGYGEAGGHAAIRDTLHDGIQLPRAFRGAGLKTDLCDASNVATCRMYRGAGEVWRGLAKNATEGLGSPRLILPSTLLLLCGQVLPFVLLALAPWLSATALCLAAAATLCAYGPRLGGAVRFRQKIPVALLHPIGVVILVTIQWYALLRFVLGRPSAWKGRTYSRLRTRSPRQRLMSGGMNE
jgi:Glycosyl transferase family 2